MRDLLDYYRIAEENVCQKINDADESKMINCEIEELTDYFFDQFGLEPIQIINKSQDNPTKETLPSGSIRGGRLLYSERIKFGFTYTFVPSKTFGTVIKLRKVPTTGSLYDLKINEQDNICQIEISPNKTDQEVAAGFINQQLENFEKEIENANAVIEEENTILKQRIASVVEKRKQALTKDRDFINKVSNLIKVPLTLVEDPEKEIKVSLKVKEDISKIIESKHPKQKEFYLDKEDIKTLIRIINYQCLNFERTPNVYRKLDENDLRDILLSTLNAVFGGSATGETFSNRGKTDIYLKVVEGDVFIAECKLWDGPQLFIDTLKQLFGYLTWRENFGVLIDFCSRRSMSALIGKAKEAIIAEASFVELIEEKDAYFVTRHKHPEDENKTIDVYSLFYKI